jgi:hypothetical protein
VVTVLVEVLSFMAKETWGDRSKRCNACRSVRQPRDQVPDRNIDPKRFRQYPIEHRLRHHRIRTSQGRGHGGCEGVSRPLFPDTPRDDHVVGAPD